MKHLLERSCDGVTSKMGTSRGGHLSWVETIFGTSRGVAGLRLSDFQGPVSSPRTKICSTWLPQLPRGSICWPFSKAFLLARARSS